MFYRILFFLLFFLFSGTQVQAQARLDLVAHLPYDTIVNNCWGYVHPDGTEYAFVGTSTGLSIVSLLDPENPQELHRITEPYALWRDIFTYNDFAYAVADQFSSDKGVLILDLGPLPGMPIVNTWRPYLDTFGDSLNRCHNLSIDEQGLLFLSGCNVNNGGVFMADLNQDPWEPAFIGPAENLYSHDSHVLDNLLYSSNIQDGTFSIIDISDPFQPELLAQQETPFEFTHNTWTSDDQQYLFTTDEKSNAPVASYDISDFENIKELDQYRPQESIGLGVLPHNVQVINDYLIISYYSEGCIMVDGARPHNLIEVAKYDTYEGQTNGFRGNWGAYLWYPSGLFIASDITNGLFVLNPTYKRACYLEGKVTDAQTGGNIAGAKVIIEADQLNLELTNLQGNYATGIAKAGSYFVQVTKPGYFPYEAVIELENGVLLELDVALEPLPTYDLEGKVIDNKTKLGIPLAWITLTDGELTYEAQTNVQGEFMLEDVFQGVYQCLSGAWSYKYFTLENLNISNEVPIHFELDRGYEDLFEFDLGWDISGDAAEGVWEQAIPLETATGSGRVSNPGMDSPNDKGFECFVTGNNNESVSADEVDLRTTLTSPIMNINQFLAPKLEFDYWFFNAWTNIEPDDSLTVRLILDASETIEILAITSSKSEWLRQEVDLSPFIGSANLIQIAFSVSDKPINENLLEAGIDNFRVIEGTEFTNPEIQRDEFTLDAGPNPTTDKLTIYYQIENVDSEKTLELHDVSGKLVELFNLDNTDGFISLEVSHYASGVYFISLVSDGKRSPSKKFIKLSD